MQGGCPIGGKTQRIVVDSWHVFLYHWRCQARYEAAMIQGGVASSLYAFPVLINVFWNLSCISYRQQERAKDIHLEGLI